MLGVFAFTAFISLLDNYVSDTGEPEIVTPEEVAENHKFLDSIVKTPTMKVHCGQPALWCWFWFLLTFLPSQHDRFFLPLFIVILLLFWLFSDSS